MRKQLLIAYLVMLGVSPACAWAQTAKERYDNILRFEQGARAKMHLAFMPNAKQSAANDWADESIKQTDAESALEALAKLRRR
jgi:hypothetical protein